MLRQAVFLFITSVFGGTVVFTFVMTVHAIALSKTALAIQSAVVLVGAGLFLVLLFPIRRRIQHILALSP